jgi:chromosome segregation ATPase
MVRQANMLAALFDNWGKVTQAQNIAADSMGMAAERYEIYMNSIEAASNRIQTKWEAFWQHSLESGFMKFLYTIADIALTPTKEVFTFGFGGVEGAKGKLENLKAQLEELKSSSFGGDLRKKEFAIAALEKRIKDLENSIKSVTKETDDSSRTWHEFNDKASETKPIIEEIVDSFEELKQASDDSTEVMLSNQKALQSIMEDYTETGQLTTQQAIDMINMGYAEAVMIDQKTGAITINIAALNNLVIAEARAAANDALLAAQASGTRASLDQETIALWRKYDALNAIANQISNMPSMAYTSPSSIDSGANDAEQAYQDLLQMTIKMLRQKKEAQKEALQQELEAYKRIIDARKKILDQKREEEKYQDKIAEKNKEISDIDNELLELQFDNSEEAKKRRLELEAERAEKVKELDDEQADHSVETQKDALDDEYEDFKKGIDKKIDAIDKYLSQSGKITAEAIALLKEHSDSLFNQLLEWNRVYGSGIQSDVIDKWGLATQAVNNYASAAAQAASIPVGTNWGDEGWGGNPIWDQVNPYDDDWDDEGWGGDPIWDQVNPYHSGGVAGDGLPNLQSGEIYAKLLKGEVITNDQQMSNFINKTLPSLVAGVGGGNSGLTIGDIVLHVAGNLDKTVLPDLKDVILTTVYNAMKMKGNVRNANNFSI